MNLDDAVKHFESKFEKVEPSTKVDEAHDMVRVCSGGIANPEELLPALYSSEELAVEAWFEVANFHAGYARAKLEWVLKPELQTFQITMADKQGRHRLVSNRYAVKSQFKVERN